MAFYVPEGFTRNSSGEVFKSKNDLRKNKGNGILAEDLKGIKRSKKNAARNVRNKDNALAKILYQSKQAEQNTITIPIQTEGKTIEQITREKKYYLKKLKRKSKQK